MEVHAHSHTPRKKWTHYFWEFLMLFLAVFCGFLAENFREHQVEHQREKQYMQSFIYDLQNDTANLNAGFPLKDDRVIAIDSVFLFFERNPDVTKIPGKVFRHIQRTVWDRHYRRNSTTIDQLKNAGGMRLIRKKISQIPLPPMISSGYGPNFGESCTSPTWKKEKDLLKKFLLQMTFYRLSEITQPETA